MCQKCAEITGPKLGEDEECRDGIMLPYLQSFMKQEGDTREHAINSG